MKNFESEGSMLIPLVKAIKRADEIERDYGVKCPFCHCPFMIFRMPCLSNAHSYPTGKAYQVNILTEDAVKKNVDEIVREFGGRLDVFVANSGVAWTQGPALDGDLPHYHKVVSTDFDGTFYCARAAGEHWKRQKFEGVDIFGKKIENFTYGSFIATASMSGHIVNIPQLQAAYNAAKAGVIHMTKSLAVEWVKFARANCVSPGYIATEITKFIPPETKAIWNSKIPMGSVHSASRIGPYSY